MLGILALAGLSYGLRSVEGPSAWQIRGSGTLGVGSSPTRHALGTSQSTVRSALAATGSDHRTLVASMAPAPPMLEEAGPTMPTEVREWLLHLERIEGRRIQLASAQVAQAMSTMGRLQASGGGRVDMAALAAGDEEAIPGEASAAVSQIEAMNAGHESAWADIESRFASALPPAECRAIATAYGASLVGTRQMIQEVTAALAGSGADRQGSLDRLYAMVGQAETRIGRPCHQADRELGRLCARYGVDKWFELRPDVGAGALRAM